MIGIDGSKRFLPGGEIKGGYFAIGGVILKHVVVAEGFATGASIHQATGHPVAVAFSAGNLEDVARSLRQSHPKANIIIAADDDFKTPGNPGITKAKEAAKAVGGFLAVPAFGDSRSDDCTDFNDLALLSGDAAVKKCFLAALPPERSGDDWPAPIEFPDPSQRSAGLVFPTESVPKALRDAAMEVSRFTKTDEVAAFTIGFSVLATAVGKKAKVVEREGLHHYPAMFFICIADSGERKSAVFRPMEAQLSKFEKDKQAAHKADFAKAQSYNFMLDTQIDALKKQGKKQDSKDASASETLDALAEQIGLLEAQKRLLPPSPKLYDTDATEQYLVKQLHRRGGAFAVLTPEGRPLIDHLLGKYSGGDGMTGDGVYLAGISGDRITRGRVGDESGGDDFVIFDPCLNVCAMVQPDKYKQMAGHQALKDSGLVARIWPARLKPMIGQQTEHEGELGLQEALMNPYWALVDDVLHHEPKKDGAGHIIPHRAVLNREASELRRQFHNNLQGQMKEGGELSDVRSIAAKFTSQTAKLALILHCAGDTTRMMIPNSEINGDTWRAAQAIAEYYLTHSVVESRTAEEDVAIEKARRLLDWIKRLLPNSENEDRRLTRAMILQSSPRPRPTAKELDGIIGILEDFSYVRKSDEKLAGKLIYAVNPGIYK